MKTAELSDCGTYRYRLTRGKDKLMPVVMLNPSTADAHIDDPTIRKLMAIAGSNGHLGLDVINLYGLRTPYPEELKLHSDPYGPDNQYWQHLFCRRYKDDVILAWGNNAPKEAVDSFMRVLGHYVNLETTLVSCFAQNKNGSPKHPLYLKNDQRIWPYFI